MKLDLSSLLNVIQAALATPPTPVARMATALASAIRALEELGWDDLTTVRAEDVNTAAFGLAQYAEAHFGCLVPVSSEQLQKVFKQVQNATDLDVPPIYATALAAGSNWWQTPC